MIILLFLGNTRKFGEIQTITRGQGILLLICTLLYILYTIYEEKKVKNKKIDAEIIKEVESKEERSIIKIIVYLILGILGLKFGADFIVDNTILIAKKFHLTERFIGMTIIAIGTALPEIITGMIAAKNNETDLLLGNISGSNIINICLLIGLGALIHPLTFTTNFNASIWILMASTILLQLIETVSKKSELDRKKGIFLIILYGSYMCSMI